MRIYEAIAKNINQVEAEAKIVERTEAFIETFSGVFITQSNI